MMPLMVDCTLLLVPMCDFEAIIRTDLENSKYKATAQSNGGVDTRIIWNDDSILLSNTICFCNLVYAV